MNKLTHEEAVEKRHNPWHCKKCGKLVHISYGIYFEMEDDDCKEYSIPLCSICQSLDVFEKKERETPEEFENRTGNPWMDDSAVYMKLGMSEWRVMQYYEAKAIVANHRHYNISHQIYCANSDAGIPANEGQIEEKGDS
jgi:hypothetical protein